MNEEEKTPPPRERKLLIYLFVAFVVAMAAMFFWKELSLWRYEQSVAVERDAERAHLAMQESRIRDAAVARVAELLELFSIPLSWAVRTEAIREDYEQIENYMLQIVKQPSVKSVSLVARDGRIRLATDRKIQGEPAQPLFGDLTGADEVVLRSVDDELRLMVPVLGDNERLGSLIVVFSRKALLDRLE